MAYHACIVGLGNVGAQYRKHRHNAGFWFVESLAQQAGAVFNEQKKFFSRTAEVVVAGRAILLVCPNTLMNLSGQAVLALLNFYKLSPERLIVAHDELDFPPGVVRWKKGGGHGGHNGLRDIMRVLPGQSFNRLRLGIGHPGCASRVHGYVLSPPNTTDQQKIDQALESGRDILPLWVNGDIDQAIEQLHSQPQQN